MNTITTMDNRNQYLPLPPRLDVAGEFYSFLKKRELRFQRCSDCGRWRHVPRDTCAQCGSWKWEWAKSSGRGRIFSWTTVEHPAIPSFAAFAPYSPVVIEMEEGVRLVSWMVDCPAESLRLDLPVEVTFEDVTADVTLHRFRIRSA